MPISGEPTPPVPVLREGDRMGGLLRVVLWFRGWRRDLDGWLVRARNENDSAELRPELGFVEESSVAARTIDAAWQIDGGLLRLRGP